MSLSPENEADLRDVLAATFEENLATARLTRHDLEARLAALPPGKARRMAQTGVWHYGEVEHAYRVALKALEMEDCPLGIVQELLQETVSGARESRPFTDTMGQILALLDQSLGRSA